MTAPLDAGVRRVRRTVRSLKGRRELVEPWKLPGYLYHKLAKETWRPNYVEGFYEGADPPLGRTLITTPIEPFFRDPTRYDPRPGKWSKVENARSFSRLGYESDVYHMLDHSVSPERYDGYDVLFGDGPNFVTYSEHLGDDVVRICYRGGMHWTQRVEAYRRRLDELNERRGTALSAGRPAILEENEATDLADALLVMGDEYTARTFRDAGVDVPIHTIHTTHPPGYEFDTRERDYEAARRNFLWFGGTGPVLKGLDRVLEAFAGLEDLQLYVCGPVENDPAFVDCYEEELYGTDNVETVGWVDVRSRTFRDIVERCAFHVYPSGSEGSSGAVASCMWRGLVPVVTREVFADPPPGVLQFPDDDIETIAAVVRECAAMEPDEVARLASEASGTARELFGRERYSREIDAILSQILEENGLPVRE